MQSRHVFEQVFSLQTTIAEVVFGLVLAAMLASVLLSWRRHRRGLPASKRAEHNRLEFTYLLALAGIAVFLVVVSFTSNAAFFRDPPSALRVRVTAFQWCWNFQYPAQRVTVTGPCTSSRGPTLVLPAGRPVEVDLTSRDVIHSFWLPGLRLKMDIYPDHVNRITFTAPQGRWLGRCSQFCGLDHYRMTFHVEAVPQAQFTQWLRAHEAPRGPVGAS